MSALKKLAYFPLEPLQARYTELLSCEDGWAESEFEKSFDITSFRPTHLPVSTKITTGEVLDSVNRPMWALGQMQQWLIDPNRYDALYIDDFFHPGIEALPYCGKRPEKVVAYCWAQTFDQFDFTRNEFEWMRPYEVMMMNIVDYICVANELLADLLTTVNPAWDGRVIVTGLPFSSAAVVDTADLSYDPIGKPIDIIYASRLDQEKQVFLLPTILKNLPDHVEFVIATGHDKLRSNMPIVIPELEDLEKTMPNFHILKGLTKAQYYGLLSRAKIQLNTSLQDWTSYTLLEALSFGCLPVCPMYRSFVEEFASRGVYTPELTYPIDSAPEAILEQVLDLLDVVTDHPKTTMSLMQRLKPIIEHHNESLARIANVLIK